MQQVHWVGNTEIDLSSQRIFLINDCGEICLSQTEAIAVCAKVLQLFQVNVPLSALDELTQRKVERILSYS